MNSQSKNTYLSPRNTENPKHFPSITQPKIIGAFSIDENRQYLDDTRNCQYVYKHVDFDQPNFDLNAGIGNVVRKLESCQQEKLNQLLLYILKNVPKLVNNVASSNSEKILYADFVCFRGLLRLLMCTPYEHRDSWIILASKFKGTIYLCAEETEKQASEKLNQSDSMKNILSYGFKFEQYMLSGLCTRTFN